MAEVSRYLGRISSIGFFSMDEDPIGKTVELNQHNYLVVGVLARKGGGMGQARMALHSSQLRT